MINIQEGRPPEEMPAVVRALALASATERTPDPKPIKWRMSRKEDEGEGMIVIIFEHGPTLMWTEEQITATIAEMKQVKAKPAAIDMSDGVDQQEASTAGRALRARRTRK